MTVKEILQQKFKLEETRNEKLELIKSSLKVSDSHFYKKISGASPLSLKQAQICSEILKVSIGKLSIIMVMLLLCVGCANNRPTPQKDQPIQNKDSILSTQHFIFY